jgi:hypothetical protein
MDEIWVPSRWQEEVFTASGVDSHRIRVVPEVRAWVACLNAGLTACFHKFGTAGWTSKLLH